MQLWLKYETGLIVFAVNILVKQGVTFGICYFCSLIVDSYFQVSIYLAKSVI